MLYAAAGALWTAGIPLDTGAPDIPGRRVPLPGYPFERSHHWVPILPDPQLVYPLPPRTGALPVDEWFSLPAWRQEPVPPPPRTGRTAASSSPGRPPPRWRRRCARPAPRC
nr:hypothetical protein GCM10020093_013490 [Planobispora longispora]